MHDTSKGYLLQIEPKGLRSAEPVCDSLTEKMERLLRMSDRGSAYRGFHVCSCGEFSGSHDWILPDGMITNSLAVHYLKWHRNEVPVSEIEKLERIKE